MTLVRHHRVHDLDVLTLASPANRNALSVPLLEELLDHVEASADRAGRGLVLDHIGPAFCAGVDLTERLALGPADQTHSALLGQLLRQLWAYPGPVLCRVDGAVRGGGMGLVAAADLVVASAASTFAYREVRIGVAPALVAAVAMAKVAVGPLLPWLLTGETFDAVTAQRLGLVTRVAEGATTLDPEYAALGRCAPGAVAAVKRLARSWPATPDLDTVLVTMEEESARLFASPEAQEGLAAFAAGRQPAWVVA